MEHDKSILMQKQVRDNSEDLQKEFLDLKNWEEQMKRKEQEILNERNEQEIMPPIRIKKKHVTKEDKTSKNSKRIKSYDYTAWDKFDIDKACKDLDKEQSDESSEEILSKEELEKNHNKALEYKQQGNDFVKQKKWDKAIASYSEAIKIFPYDAVFYANRALCYLKQDNLYSAEADCTSALQLDKTYVKAYHRRVTARLGLKQYEEAVEDIKKIVDLEPCSKETEILLNQVKKQFGDSFMSKRKVHTDSISDYEKDSENVDTTVKSTTININNSVQSTARNIDNIEKLTTTNVINTTELKKDSRIPDWLPEKNNVEIVEPIEKPPHLCSKDPFRKIPVQKADLSKPFKFYKEKIKTTSSDNQDKESSKVQLDNITKEKESTSIKKTKEILCKSKENLDENNKKMPSAPTNAVQFITNWKKDTSFDFRYKYLKQISPGDLPKIFQDSMESDIFSSILTILKTEFMKRNEPIFSYLKNLSNVKRFRTLIMFTNNSEKQDLKLMFSYCNTFEKISEEEITDLQNKYEV